MKSCARSNDAQRPVSASACSNMSSSLGRFIRLTTAQLELVAALYGPLLARLWRHEVSPSYVRSRWLSLTSVTNQLRPVALTRSRAGCLVPSAA
jgi:hypothetical protein